MKRSSDTRLRREVVGQMLDYAANGVLYWPVEEIRARFEARCADEDLNPGEVLAELAGPMTDIDLFWGKVKTNLQTGRVPHTTRAALTGLRKKGYQLEKIKGDDGKTVYHITALPSDGARIAAA